MTTILALETSTDQATVALLHLEQIYSHTLSGVHTHSHGLLPAVQTVLSQAGVSMNALEAIAFGCGPGAFTGVRTACGVVQGLAFALNLPVLPVLSLLAMAESVKARQAWVDLVCVLDARMNEVYWAHYRFDGAHWHCVSEPALATLSVALSYAGERQLSLALGDGVSMPESVPGLNWVREMPHAEAVLKLAVQDLARGLQVDAARAQPVYLRNKIALTTAERMLASGV